ncbi:MAG: integrase arm-type DNA-binding domain-containing protein [Rhodospirillales bacterium]|nr:integrase arm-type DNA-binding domain-containing protein [Rhodospirillales bacterium]
MGTLNAAKLRTLTKPGTFGDGGGLYLQVRGPDRRSWVFRFKQGGRGRLMGLGPYPDVGLADARAKAEAARKLLREGQDPLAVKRAARQAEARLPFREVAERMIAAHEAGWRNAKHRAQWTSTLTAYAYPVMGDLPVAAIETAHVMKALDPIWREKSETASRLRGRIEAVLDYATARGWRSGDNPARWRGHLANLLPSRAKVQRVEHHAALPWAEIGSFMRALAAQKGTGALALRFAILAAARSGEVRGATWAEIDLDSATWTVPGERMKAGREHRVPLCAEALAVLRDVAPLRDRKAGELVFPGAKRGKPLSDMSLTAVLRRMKRGDLTVHGFRSTFRQWCAEATNYPRELAEAALAHTLRDKVEAAYQRGDMMEKRRRLMAEWATFCGRPQAAGEVVPLRTGVVS